MAVALSPWPPTTSVAARTAAVARLREAVAGRTLASDDAANALGEAASALVEDYAPSAPQAVKDEAVIRLAGWLAGSSFDNVTSETSVASATVQYQPGSQNLMIRSGAGSLLTRWRVRRAGAIG